MNEGPMGMSGVAHEVRMIIRGEPGAHLLLRSRVSALVMLTLVIDLAGTTLAWLLEHGGGAIVNTASLFSDLAFPGTAVYCATKFGVAGLTRSATSRACCTLRCVGCGFSRSASMIRHSTPAMVRATSLGTSLQSLK